MGYRVLIDPKAVAEIEEAYVWLAQQAPRAALRWFNGLYEAIESLRDFPRRCALAPETRSVDREVRQLLFGRRGGVYRVLFSISGQTVQVLRVRHSARAVLPPDEDCVRETRAAYAATGTSGRLPTSSRNATMTPTPIAQARGQYSGPRVTMGR